MKYLKKFNEEYSRTVGFRYSEPKIEMQLKGVYIGNLKNESHIINKIAAFSDSFNAALSNALSFVFIILIVLIDEINDLYF
jgi:hypothetical protein